MNEVICELVFPTPILVLTLDDAGYRQKLIDLTGRKRESCAGVRKTNMNGGWQSTDDFLNDRECKELRTDLENAVSVIKDSLKIAEELKIDNSWANVSGRGAYNVRHVHSRSFFSGVYYLKTPQDCGNIIFYSPLVVQEMIGAKYHEPSAISSKQLIYPAVAGRVYIFPSWLGHSVEPNESDEDRISVSFNVFLDNI